jgi:hypothetical protein
VNDDIPAEAVLMILSQVPVTPFLDMVGRAGATEFLQNGPIGSKAGIVGSFTLISMVTTVAHSLASGVKV